MFHSARLKLTAWYLLIIMSISILFSSIIYRGLMGEVYRFEKEQRFRFEQRLEEGFFVPSPGQRVLIFQHIPVNEELIEETRKRVLIMLVTVNAGILFISGMLGYILAGRTLQPIKEMMEEQNRFISDASHEFRTPLTSLKTAFEVFLRNKKESIKEAKAVITDSIDEVNKLQSLSESLLQLAQYEKPNGHTSFSKIQLHSVIGEAVGNVLQIAQKKNITIEYKQNEVMIEGNTYGLVDLFVILLDNAIKYSPQNSKIYITSKKESGIVEVSVSDNGMGIKDTEIKHIFDRFYRADSARSKSFEGGYGLGLAIAKKIVDVHKGSIQVVSKPGKGSTFIVKIPIKHASTLQKAAFFS